MRFLTEIMTGFYIDFNILHLGGPDFCQRDLPSNDTFDDSTSPRINIVLCGVPQPVVQAEFIGQKLIALNRTINNYKHNYTLELPRLTQTVCGKELRVTATGHNGTSTKNVQVFVRNCKYDYYVQSFF